MHGACTHTLALTHELHVYGDYSDYFVGNIHLTFLDPEPPKNLRNKLLYYYSLIFIVFLLEVLVFLAEKLFGHEMPSLV